MNSASRDEYLVKQVIPSLPCELRLPLLLKEATSSEEGDEPMTWEVLADLNGSVLLL